MNDVAPGSMEQKTSQRRFEKIVVSTNFPSISETAVDYSINIARQLDVEVTLIHIIPLFKENIVNYYSLEFGDNVFACQESKATKELKVTCEAAREKGVKMDFKIFRAPDVAEAIIQIAEDGNFDMIIIGSHGRSGLKRWILGSIAEKVIRNAQCPVLSIKSRNHFYENGVINEH